VTLELALHTLPAVPLEAEVLSPARLAGLSERDVVKLGVIHGNQRAELGEFFRVTGSGDGELRLSGDLSRIKQVGAGMATGRLVVEGSVGMHLGAGMTGGEIIVEGNAGDWVGPEMAGGRIVIKGNAGHMVGSATRGSAVGMRGGEILVFGSAGNEVGAGMRRGFIAVAGECGDFAGVNMLAGTVVALGAIGWRAGAGLRRGTIVAMHPVEMLPTFTYSCSYRPPFLRLVLLHLQRLGLPVSPAMLESPYQRWCGDAVELNRGEILVLDRAAAGSS
jgi:formylmethanofuran dehydrogenase subunit C